MYIEEARWVRQTLAGIALPPGATVLNSASSTEHFRTVEQPHIETDVLAPLRERGAQIRHLDMKDAPGVDIVCDMNDPSIEPRRDIGEDFDLVLATGFLQHLDDVTPVASALVAVMAPGGYLLVTTPESYRRTLDPVDYGYRPSPGEIVAAFQAVDPSLEAVATASVRIDDRRYYKGLVSRLSWIPIRGRWAPLPGFTDQLRRAIKPLRWRESCVLLRKRPNAGQAL